MANVLRTPKSKDRPGGWPAEEPSPFNLSRMVSAVQNGKIFRGEMRDEQTELHTKPFLTLLYILYLENLGLGRGRHW